jgi:type II secretory pathway pseudopilin PulG
MIKLNRIITSLILLKPASQTRRSKPAGDTLIEVMFAFVILGSIISFAYTGVIQARRSALDAQQRTQATFIAQYQKNALNAYRSGLPWNVEGGSPNFLEGGVSTTVPVNGTDKFCMDLNVSSGTPAVSNWILKKETDPATNCTIPAGELYGGSGKQKITFAPYSAQGLTPTNCNPANLPLCSSLQATIVVSWQSTSGIENSVTNTVVLTQ